MDISPRFGLGTGCMVRAFHRVARRGGWLSPFFHGVSGLAFAFFLNLSRGDKGGFVIEKDMACSRAFFWSLVQEWMRFGFET